MSSIAQRLYTDALHCIFSFLSLGDLVPAITACRSWKLSAYKEKSRGVRISGACDLLSLLHSPSRFHVNAYENSHLFLFTFIPLLQQLPFLADLNLRVSLEDITEQLVRDKKEGEESLSLRARQIAARWPQRIQKLTVEIVVKPDENMTRSKAKAAQMMVLIASSLPSLIDLTFYCGELDVDLSPLLTLRTQLTRLCVSGINESSIAVIKQMEVLRHIDTDDCWLEGLQLDQLQLLCSLPHKLHRLEEIDMRSTELTRKHMLALARLPALTRLEPESVHPDSLSLLDQFPRLRILRIDADQTHLVMASLPSLTELTLDYCRVKFYDQSLACLARMPQLRRLTLYDLDWPSLLGLRPLVCLEELSLAHCAQNLESHLPDLYTVPSLRKLQFYFQSDRKRRAANRVCVACRASPLLAHIESITVVE